MSSNLGITQMTSGQTGKHLTHNNALADIDALLSETKDVDVTGGYTLTQADYEDYIRYNVNASTGAADLTFRLAKKMGVISIDAAISNVITLKRGTTEYDVTGGFTGFFYTDGTSDGLFLGSDPNALTELPDVDLAFFFAGEQTDGELLARMIFESDVDFPTSLTGSAASAVTASAADKSLTLKKNGSSIGSVRFNISATGSFVFASPVSFTAGDILTINAPNPADVDLADVSVTLKGTRP